MSSAWNSAKTDNLTTLPSNVSYYYFSPQISVCYVYLFCIHIGEKRISTSEDTRNPTPPKEGEQLTTQPEDVDSEVQEVAEMVTTTGDVDVVEEETHFNSASAQVLINEIMVCNRDLEKVKQNINDVQKRLTKIIDVLAKI
ncbi:hypothetical protein AB205_0162250 [Aquarana catesbeiana]|uniref:Uncharacterized protein n=1 Tax=Aquarana catesbeiana TaxID=8400 RepID=A0A2G9R6U5_AQUCT|nr:hypothetical protein AB205_0162250 [Aquarana catesbeiana]